MLGSKGTTTAKGGAGVRVDLAHVPVEVGAVEGTVEGDHLSVEPVQGPEAEVSMLGELPRRKRERTKSKAALGS